MLDADGERIYRCAVSLQSLDPLDPKVTQFIQDNPQGVLTTYRRSGKAQMSIVDYENAPVMQALREA